MGVPSNKTRIIAAIVIMIAAVTASYAGYVRKIEAEASSRLQVPPLVPQARTGPTSTDPVGSTQRESPSYERPLDSKPDGMHLLFYDGGPFEGKAARYYALNASEVSEIRAKAQTVKRLDAMPAHNPSTLPLRLSFGKDDNRWFFITNDGKTLFYNGSYYHGPALSESVLRIANDKFGFVPFDTRVFSRLTKAQYAFKTRTGVIERFTEDRAILAKIETEIKKAQHHPGGGCPFSDGVLTLTFDDGRKIDISMASDDCPLMFLNKNFLKYSDELHHLLRTTFDNFPYVRS